MQKSIEMTRSGVLALSDTFTTSDEAPAAERMAYHLAELQRAAWEVYPGCKVRVVGTDTTMKRRPGRPCKTQEPTLQQRMADALIVRTCNFDDVACAKAILRRAGFPKMQIDAMTQNALAVAKARVGRR